MQPDRVPDACPQSPAPVLVSMVALMVMFVTVILLVVMFVTMVVVVVVAGVLVPHLPRMTWKTPCSISTPAILALLQKPRRPKPLQRARWG
jgi:hypothetical protein